MPFPNEWRFKLKESNYTVIKNFDIQEQIEIKWEELLINKVVSKTIYKELRNRIITTPTAQKKDDSCFLNDDLNWKEIYSLSHCVTSGTKLREFQSKLLNKYHDMIFSIKLVLYIRQHVPFAVTKTNPSSIY